VAKQFDKVLIPGGSGYVGSMLVPKLLDQGYDVTVVDIPYFGKGHLPLDHPNLTFIAGDIRDSGTLAEALRGVDAVIQLACISNDASFDLDENLSTTINLDPFHEFDKVVVYVRAHRREADAAIAHDDRGDAMPS
jgi:nucleoside-diphosphate-sugar epimerase